MRKASLIVSAFFPKYTSWSGKRSVFHRQWYETHVIQKWILQITPNNNNINLNFPRHFPWLCWSKKTSCKVIHEIRVLKSYSSTAINSVTVGVVCSESTRLRRFFRTTDVKHLANSDHREISYPRLPGAQFVL